MKMRFLLYALLIMGNCSKGQGTLGAISLVPPKTHAAIIQWGESNAGGRGQNSAASSWELSVRQYVKILNNNTLQFESLHIPYNNIIGHAAYNPAISAVEHGWELGIADNVDSGRLPPMYLVKTAQGGSTIAQWATTGAAGFRYWDSLTKRLDIAKTLLSATGNGSAPQFYMFASIGINDAIAGTSVATWKAAIKQFIADVRTRYGTVPVFMTLLPSGNGYDIYNSSMTAIAGEISDFYTIQTSDAPGDGVHWNYVGQKIISTRMIQTLIAHYHYY